MDFDKLFTKYTPVIFAFHANRLFCDVLFQYKSNFELTNKYV